MNAPAASPIMKVAKISLFWSAALLARTIPTESDNAFCSSALLNWSIGLFFQCSILQLFPIVFRKRCKMCARTWG